MNANRLRFVVESEAFPGQVLDVLELSLQSRLSHIFELSVTVASSDSALDLGKAMHAQASLRQKNRDNAAPIGGLIMEMEQGGQIYGRYLYKLVISPQLALLRLNAGNQVFLHKTIPQVLTDVLKQAGLTSHDYEFNLKNTYPEREYTCQYLQSHFDFFSYWCEQVGIYYYYLFKDGHCKIVLTDYATGHGSGQPHAVDYLPPTGLEDLNDDIVTTLLHRRTSVSQKVKLKDYSLETPTLDLLSESQVSNGGVGEFYLYGENAITPVAHGDLARVRAEEFGWAENLYLGESVCPAFLIGREFKLAGHFNSAYNARFLLVEVNHEGKWPLDIEGGGPVATEAEYGYRNSFVAIPHGVPFRPDRLHSRPRIMGVIPAKIDGESSGQYAELDKYGRYKIRLPFDLSDRGGGKASHWIPKMHTYSGRDHGIHFPMLKGSDVLLSFIEGDLDRPVIVGAIPNSETPSVVTEERSALNTLKTPSGATFIINDKKGAEGAGFSNPAQKTFLVAGAQGSGESGMSLYTEGDMSQVTSGQTRHVSKDQRSQYVGGDETKLIMGNTYTVCPQGGEIQAFWGNNVTWQKGNDFMLRIGSQCNLQDSYLLGTTDGIVLGGGMGTDPTKSLSDTRTNTLNQANEKGQSVADQCKNLSVGDEADAFVQDPKGWWDNDSRETALKKALTAALNGLAQLIPILKDEESLPTAMDTYSSADMAGKLTLNKDGANLTANLDVTSTGTVTLQSTQASRDSANNTLTLDSSGITLDAGNGTCQLSLLSEQKEVLLEIGDTSLTMDSSNAVSVKSDSLSMEHNNSARISVSSGSVSLGSSSVEQAYGSSSVKVSNSGVTLSFSTGRLSAGTLSVDASGMIQLG